MLWAVPSWASRVPPPESTVEITFSSGTAEKILSFTLVVAEMPEGRDAIISAAARRIQTKVTHLAPLPVR